MAILIESVHRKSQKSFCIKKEIKINNNYNKMIIKILLIKLSFKNYSFKTILKNFLSADHNKKTSWKNEDTTSNKKIFILYLVATVTELEKHYVFSFFSFLSPLPLPPLFFPFDILHPTVMDIKLNELV